MVKGGKEMKRKYIIGVGLAMAIIATVSIGIIVNKNNILIDVYVKM